MKTNEASPLAGPSLRAELQCLATKTRKRIEYHGYEGRRVKKMWYTKTRLLIIIVIIVVVTAAIALLKRSV